MVLASFLTWAVSSSRCAESSLTSDGYLRGAARGLIGSPGGMEAILQRVDRISEEFEAEHDAGDHSLIGRVAEISDGGIGDQLVDLVADSHGNHRRS